MALTLHIYSAFSTAAKILVITLLFSALLLLLDFKINASSREKEVRRSGGRGRNLLLQFLGGEKLGGFGEFLLNIR